ncbi:MAG: heavy metal sensor histidine kinase [Chthoniobacterales bacterium]
MSSRSFEARSIASQLVLLFTLAATLLLCSGLGFLYWIVVRHALEEDNAVLADKIFAVRADLHNPGGPQALDEQLKTLRRGERLSYWVRVINASGRAVVEPAEMGSVLPPAVFSEATARGGAVEYQTGDRLFSLGQTNETIEGQVYTIQIAQDRTMDERFERKFRVLLGVVLVCGILAAAAVARIFTHRSLQPLVELTGSLQRIGPKRMHERVPPEGWPRELQPLAVAYDEMLDRLEDSFTRLSQFSADLAHELRTPIANLRGEAEVTLTRLRTPEEYREVLESSVDECARLSGIIDNLLFLARAEAADGPIPRTHFDGRKAIEKILGYYETVAEEQRLTMTCAGEGEIFADAQLFSRAISNLVDNAIRFTPEGGTIEISITTDAAASRLSVRDSGRGIGAEHLPRIFDRFYRADSSRSSVGTGLGLALVKSITDLHAGRAEVQSEGARGTMVTLIFPNESKAPSAAV